MARTAIILETPDDIAKLIAPALTTRDYAVVSAESGSEALKKFSSGTKFDVVIVGEELVDVDGISAIAKLRPLAPQSKFVYVADSWKGAALYQEIRKKLRVDLVIHRPLKSSLVIAQIDALFEVKRHEQEVPYENVVIKRSQAEYLKKLPGRIAEIAAALNQSRTVQASLIDPGRMAHNLKGTSLSYGLDAVGVKAAVVEELCLRAATDTGFSTVHWEEIDTAFLALKETVDRANDRAVAADELKNSGANGNDTATQDLEDVEPSRMKAVYCGLDPLPLGIFNGDRRMDVVQVNDPNDVLDKAYVVSADALMFDMRKFDQNSCFEIARQVRSFEGNETLPLGFVLKDSTADARVQAVHLGASISLEPEVESDAVFESMKYLVSIRRPDRQRVLAIDDDPDFCALVTGILNDNGILARSVCDPQEAESVLESWEPDLLLLDVNMPGVSGYEVCKRIRTSPRWQELPIIFLTAQTGLDARLAAFQAGGDDYLPKPVADVELLIRVRVRLDRLRLLRERADKDALTGLLLRRAFLENLEAVVTESKRHDLNFCLALIDIDHFKLVNDLRGHLSGDRVLAHFGDLLKKRFRVEDVRGRWGGEEFIIAFRRAPRRNMAPALARVLQELKVMPMRDDKGNAFFVSFSAGMADFPEDGQTIHDLIQKADERLYIAKNSGRARIVVSEGEEYA